MIPTFIIEKEHLVLIRAFLKILNTYRKEFFKAGVFMLGALFVSLPMPFISIKIVDIAIKTKNLKILFLLVCFWCFAVVLRIFLDYFQSLYVFRFQMGSLQAVKSKIYGHILTLPLIYFKNKQSGYLINRISTDTDELVTFLGNSTIDLIRSIFSFLVSIFFICFISWRLSLLALLFLPFFLLNQKLFNNKIRKLSKVKKEKWAFVNGFLHELLSGLISIKVHTNEDYEVERFNEKSEVAIKSTELIWKSTQFSTSLSGLIHGLLPILIFSYAAFLIINNLMTIGELIGFIGYLGLIYVPVTQISAYFVNMQSSLISLERIYEILNSKHESNKRGKCDTSNFPKRLNIKGEIVFENLDFYYSEDENKFQINNLNLRIAAGEKIGLIGKSGSGKTSLLYLLLRLYDPITGKIFIDGIDISEMNIKDLRGCIGSVLQEPFLFSGTIRENLKYANQNASDEEMIRAATICCSHRFIMEMPNNYDSIIGTSGHRLSSGQKQLIAITRVFLQNPRILILDEATSAMDSQLEKCIKNALEILMNSRTAIIISHRLQSLDISRLVLMDSGKIIASGNHKELYQTNEIYKGLFDSTVLLNSDSC